MFKSAKNAKEELKSAVSEKDKLEIKMVKEQIEK